MKNRDKVLVVADLSTEEKAQLEQQLQAKDVKVCFSELVNNMKTKHVKVTELDDAVEQLALAIYIEAQQKKCNTILILCCEILQQALKEIAKRKNFVFMTQTTYYLNQKLHKDVNSNNN